MRLMHGSANGVATVAAACGICNTRWFAHAGDGTAVADVGGAAATAAGAATTASDDGIASIGKGAAAVCFVSDLLMLMALLSCCVQTAGSRSRRGVAGVASAIVVSAVAAAVSGPVGVL